VLESLDAAAVRRWCAAGLASLLEHQQEIDDLNVFPVPDSDTGTNLVVTITAAQEALTAEPDGDEPADPGELTRLGRVLRCMARGALLGARGNSGVIMAQLLQGLADALAVTPQARGRVLAGALAEAVASAYTVVAEPVEGTLLSVARGAAEEAARADSDELVDVVSAAARGAAEALARTPQQLPVLARAGVVDAGGRGLVLILDALVQVVGGAAVATAPLAAVAADPALLDMPRETGDPAYGYEVQYLLDAPADAVEALRAALARLGDSLVVVATGLAGPTGPTWNVHVHVNDVGAAIEAGIDAGRPHRISVTRFADQTATPPRVSSSASGLASAPGFGSAAGLAPASGFAPAQGRAVGEVVIALADGAGLTALFTGEKVRVLPATAGAAELIAEIEAAAAERVVLLPNDAGLLTLADTVAGQLRGQGRTIAVVPTRSPVQGLAALAVRDPARRFEDDVIAMAEAAGACRYGHVGHCGAEVVGFVGGEARVTGAEVGAVARELLDVLLAGGGELVTVLLGAKAPGDLAAELTSHLDARWAGVEVQSHDGGQPHPLLVGVE
jgi:uncharacterized protein